MPTVSEALHKFLQARKTPANADLIDRWSIAMETQVNVAVGDGEPVEGKRSTFSQRDRHVALHPHPQGCQLGAHWEDYELRYSFTEHAEGIGMTGWDWQNRRSLSVAYDFDALTSHAKGVGITQRGPGAGQAEGDAACPTWRCGEARAAAGCTSAPTWTASPVKITRSMPPWPAASWA